MSKSINLLIRMVTVLACMVTLAIGLHIQAEAAGTVYEVKTALELQNKINEAQSGDTVVLMNDITLSSAIKIYNGRFFTIASPEGQNYSLLRADEYTGDMIKNNSSHVTFSRVTLDGRNVEAYGAIVNHICAGSTTLSDGSVIKNHNSTLMAAVSLLESGRIEIGANSGIEDCSSPFGGAIYAAPGNVGVQANGFISNCSTEGTGGAIYVSGRTCIVSIQEGAIISNNRAGVGGAVAGTDGANLKIYGTIRNNRADKQGGGVYVSEASLLLDGAKIYGNSAAANANNTDGTAPSVRNGQDIYAGSGSTVKIQGSVRIDTEFYLDSGVELNVTEELSSENPIPLSTNVNKARYFPAVMIVSDYYVGNNGNLGTVKNLFKAYSINADPVNALFALDYNEVVNKILSTPDVPLTVARNEAQLKSMIAKAVPGEVTYIKIGGNIGIYTRIDISWGRQIVLIAETPVNLYKMYEGDSMVRIVGGALSEDPIDKRAQLTLGANVTLRYGYSSDTAPLIIADNTRFTMLADSVISGAFSSPVQLMYSGEFIMEGGEIRFARNNGVVNMNLSTGSFTMNGGKIAGCSGTNGGAVYIPGGTTFTMNGGKIYLNKAVYGGGVYVAAGGTFVMNSGIFEDNSVIYQNESNSGGGVYVAQYGTMDMYGGEFIYNKPSVLGALDKGGMPGGAMLIAGTLNLYSPNIQIKPSANAWQSHEYGDIAVDGGIINVKAFLTGMSPKINIAPVVRDINIGHNIIHYDNADYNTANDGTGEFNFINSTISTNVAEPYTTVVATKVDLSEPVTWSGLQAAVDAAPEGTPTKITLHNPTPQTISWLAGNYPGYNENANGSSIAVNSTVSIPARKEIEISYKNYDPALFGASPQNQDLANLVLRRHYGSFDPPPNFAGPIFEVADTAKLTFSNIRVENGFSLSSGSVLTLGENSSVVSGTGNSGIVNVPSGAAMSFQGGRAEVNVSGTLNIASGTPKVHVMAGGVANMSGGSFSIDGTAFEVQSGAILNLTGGIITQTSADANTIDIQAGGTANISGGTIQGPGKPDDSNDSPITRYVFIDTSSSYIINWYRLGCGIDQKGTLNMTGGRVSGFYTGIRLHSTEQRDVTLSGATITGNMFGISNILNQFGDLDAEESTVPTRVALDGCTLTGNYQKTKVQRYKQSMSVYTFGGDVALKGSGSTVPVLDLNTASPSTVGTVNGKVEISTTEVKDHSVPALTLGGGAQVTGTINASVTSIAVGAALTGETARFSIAQNPGTHVVSTASYTGGVGTDIAPYFTSPEFFVAEPSALDGTLTFTWPTTSPGLGLAVSKSSEVEGVSVDLTITINAAATGTVSVYYDDQKGLRTIPLTGLETYTLFYQVPAVGPHTLYAKFNGDRNYLGSTVTKPFTVTGVCETTEEVQNSINNAPENVDTVIALNGELSLDAFVIDGNKDITLQSASLLQSVSERVLYNAHSESGAWITIESGSTLRLDGVVLDGNAAEAAGENCIVVKTGGTLVLENGATIRNSKTFNPGGAIAVEGGTLTIVNGKIHGNTAPLGGAIYVNGGTVNLQGSSIYLNRAGTGGGLYIHSGTVNMTGGNIYNNTALDRGAGIYLKSAGTLNLSGSATVFLTNAVYLDSGAYVTVNGALTSGSSVASIASAPGIANTKIDVVKANYVDGSGEAILESFLMADGSDPSVSATDDTMLQKSFGKRAYFNLSYSPTTAITYADTVVVTLAYDALTHADDPVPTGQVTFYEGATALGTATALSNGSASISIKKPTAGSHTISFAYSGDEVYLPILAANSTTKTFSAAPANLTGTVSITGDVIYKKTLTATVTGFPDDAGVAQVQWTRDGVNISGATSSTLSLTSEDVGKPIAVKVSSLSANYTGTISGGPTANVAKADITGTVSITGDVIYKETLTATVTGFPDDAGEAQIQWVRDGEEIAGATVNTLRLTAEDIGKPIYAKVSSLSKNYTGTISSDPTVNVEKADLTGTVSITGDAFYGGTLTAVVEDFPEDAGLPQVQWVRDGVNIEGATATTLSLTSEDVGKPIHVRVSSLSERYKGTISASPTEVGKRAVMLDELQIEPIELIYSGETKPVVVALADGFSGLGEVTVYYKGETTVPTMPGTYELTADFAEGLNYRTAVGLEIGELTIRARPISTVSAAVNGNAVEIGKTETVQVGGQQTTIFTLDDAKVGGLASASAPHMVIRMLEKKPAQIMQLAGKTVETLTQNQTIITLQTDSVSYTLPAEQIRLDTLLDSFAPGTVAKDISVRIKIADPTEEQIKLVQSASESGKFDLVLSPVVFEVSASDGHKTVSVSRFNAYLERTILIPEGVEIERIATAAVIEPDGTVRPVPTKIQQIDGKYYAVIQSMTNSVYSLISRPVQFSDLKNSWAKEVVDELGSRMILNGVGDGRFEPNRAITRAEFAATLIRALGLKPGTGTNQFTDVKSTDWFSNYITTAAEYGILSGYGNGKFGPNDKITREQAMVMVARAMNLTGLKAGLTGNEVNTILKGFRDASGVQEYARNGIAACVKTGIVSGRTDNLLAPKAYITRAEVAAIVTRLLEKSDLI